ncbi:MAG TPA: hypothetical protein PLN52_22185 [Opitutaceae bacterium]|nr:hypothetical protein [Opitutaceae bacterium]
MKLRFSLFSALLAVIAGLSSGHAQSVIFDDALAPFVRPPGVTRLQLATDISNGFVPPEFPGRVRVPPYEQVWLLAPTPWPYPIQWTKNGNAIPGATSSPLILRQVTGEDSGLYSLAVTELPPIGEPAPIATRIQLDVVREGHVGNFSARVILQPGNDTQIVGYVVEGRVPKRLLIRAVGPSLKQFGVSQPAALPRFRLLTSDGNEFTVIRPAVVYPLAYWTALFKQAGAFPLVIEGDGERAHLAFDTYDLPPGAYTVHVTDDAALGGQVLVEVYEFDTYPPLFGGN